MILLIGRRLTMLLGITFSLLMFSSLSWAEYREGETTQLQARHDDYVPHELIVKFKANAFQKSTEGNLEFLTESLQSLFKQFPIAEIEPVFHAQPPESDLGRTFKIKFIDSVPLHEAQSAFAHDPSVEYAEPNYIYHTQTQAL